MSHRSRQDSVPCYDYARLGPQGVCLLLLSVGPSMALSPERAENEASLAERAESSLVEATDPPVDGEHVADVNKDGEAQKALAGKRRGRPSQRPKIDFDQEIEEANRLGELFKRMQHASKVASRNALRSKQRLLRKANKLSESDLMRLAVLKRCGFVDVEGEPEGEVSASAAACSASPKAAEMAAKGKESMNAKLHGMVALIPGASELLKSLDGASAAPTTPSTTSSSACAASASSSTTPPKLRRVAPIVSVPLMKKPRTVSDSVLGNVGELVHEDVDDAEGPRDESGAVDDA
jgi:hypothetical protein